MITLSSDQKKALDDLLVWYKKDKNQMAYVTLSGYAGTGKTTLIAVLRHKLHQIDKKLKVGFVSYTGKAARVLRLKLKEEKAMNAQDFVGTIHSLIYSPIVNDKEEIIGWKTKDEINRSLVIIDEASMVDETIWRHLLSYRVPIIAVGDHGQLPPIKGRFNLMQNPNLLLKKIHRQAKKDPIIDLSIQAREKGSIETRRYTDQVQKYSMMDMENREIVNDMLSDYRSDTLILCGYNHTRKKLNHFIRTALGFESTEPVIGDRVICLRNNQIKQIYNGMLGTVVDIRKKNEDWYLAQIDMDGENKAFKGLISVEQFNSDSSLNFTNQRSRIMKGDLFDFGYALTVHKAQGSQAKRVILFEERFRQMNDDDWKRWLYTAVTRAEEELYIFSSQET